MICRSHDRGEDSRAKLIHESGSDAIDLFIGDLSSTASVRTLAGSLNDSLPRIDVLVNNAGALFSKRELSVDGIEMSFATNFLGPFLLTNLLLSGLKRSRSGRVINLLSSAHTISKLRLDDINFDRRFYYIMRAYGGSKLAVRLFTARLAERLAGTGIRVNSFDPGLVRTAIGTKQVVGVERLAWKLVNLFSGDPRASAEFIVHLATSNDLEEVSGKCFTRRRADPAARGPGDDRLARELWDAGCAMTSFQSRQ